jgi:hypothetical protein
MDNLVPTPVTLTADELNEVIKLVSVRGTEYGAARICRVLAGQHSMTTHEIGEACDISNISDMVLRCINPRLKSTDLYVACEKPPHTTMVQWSFYRDWAANDPDWSELDKRLGAELVQEIAQTRKYVSLNDHGWEPEDAKRYVQRIMAMSAVGGSE